MTQNEKYWQIYFGLDDLSVDIVVDEKFSSVLGKVQNNNKMIEHLAQQRAKYNRCFSRRNRENLIEYRSTCSMHLILKHRGFQCAVELKQQNCFIFGNGT